MARGVLINHKRDYQLFKFLWKWKILSTNMIATRFFKDCTRRTAYGRLQKLRRHGYLKHISHPELHTSLWGLDLNGFAAIKSSLPRLEVSAYKTEAPVHDFISALAHLGHAIQNQASHVKILSEQQLRCIDKELLPRWVPNPKLHRPDGYWYLHDKELMALEVELSTKDNIGLKQTVRFYDNHSSVDKVLWVVKTPYQARRTLLIEDELKENKPSKHNFVLLKDFLKNLWDTRILLGPDEGKTVQDITTGEAQNNPTVTPIPVLKLSLQDISLSPRKDLKFRRNLDSIYRP